MLRKTLHKAFIILIIYLQVLGFYGCTKEYSYEGGAAPDPTPAPIYDTIVTTGISLPYCDGCKGINTSATLSWSFMYDTTLLCGSVTNSVITPERNGFTFFGPSTCSLDTGLVMTVFLDTDSLETDRSHIITTHVALEYYDNTTMSDIFISNKHLISFTIESYTHSTGIATGTFAGQVRLKDNTFKAITNGKFHIQFR